MKTVFIKPENCIGCRHCEIACAVEHSKSRSLFQMIDEVPQSRPRIHIEVGFNFLTFPNRCNHCVPAPCIQVCPTMALYRDDETDYVLIDYDKCINCEACAIACPFGIITFNKVYNVSFERTVNAKCDGCIERERKGVEPACVEACKTGALKYGEVNEMIRNSRKDFTIRMLKSQSSEVETSKLPHTIEAYRSIMEKVSQLGPFNF